MPRNTNIKLRAGTQSAWAATAKTQSLSAAAVSVSGASTVVRYAALGHTFAVNDVVTITGFGVSSGDNPYNISGGIISAIVADTSFDISIASGTTGGTSTGTGTAKLVVLASGEAAVETDTKLLKIGDGTTDWAGLSYINKPFYYVLNSAQSLGTGDGEQDLFDEKMSLLSNTTYEFTIQVLIQIGNKTSKTVSFGFLQTGMTAFSTARYNWVYGNRINGTTHYATADKSVTGSSSVTDSLIILGPATESTVDDVVFFRIQGIIRTGNGASDFRPRIKFSANTGTTSVVAGSFVKLDPLGPSSVAYTGTWV